MAYNYNSSTYYINEWSRGQPSLQIILRTVKNSRILSLPTLSSIFWVPCTTNITISANVPANLLKEEAKKLNDKS